MKNTRDEIYCVSFLMVYLSIKVYFECIFLVSCIPQSVFQSFLATSERISFNLFENEIFKALTLDAKEFLVLFLNGFDSIL